MAWRLSVATPDQFETLRKWATTQKAAAIAGRSLEADVRQLP
jgi:hypothetical protein